MQWLLFGMCGLGLRHGYKDVSLFCPCVPVPAWVANIY